jgi:HAD superfamily hydrolase (TIGR01490 family)
MEIISSVNHKIANRYTVFFDLDGTLISANSGSSLVRMAYKKRIMNRTGLLKAIYLSVLYRFKLMDTVKIINSMVSWVEGIPEKTISELSSEVSSKILIPSIRQEVLSEMKIHRDKEAQVVILSSAIKHICIEVAAHLRINDILCSDLEIEDGLFTGQPLGHLCFGEEKAKRLKEYCDNNNTSVVDAWYYGDSIPDLQALNVVGHPVCVNPDRKLSKAALKNGWRICYWH